MAIEIKPETLKEITEYLQMGMMCFYHKTKGELEYFPEGLEYSGSEEFWTDVTDKIEASPDDYFEFEKMSSHEAFKVMERFINDIGHLATRAKLLTAISQKKPFANFNHLIGYYPELRQEWFAFKDQCYIEYVKEQVDAYNNLLEFDEDL